MSKYEHALRGTKAGSIALLALCLLVPLAAATPAFAQTFPQPNPAAAPQQWAWGTTLGWTSTGTASGWGPSGNWSYETDTHAFLGWNVVLTQTNTSTTTFTLQEQRDLAASVDVEACSPTCSAPKASVNFTASGWETDNAFANFTTQGTVMLNGTTAVAAVAVQNAQSSLEANATAQANWQTPNGGGNLYVGAAATAQAQVSFAPALGLLPLNFSAGQWWTSASTYTGSGSYDVGCHYFETGILGTTAAGTCSSSGSLTGGGPVALTAVNQGYQGLGTRTSYAVQYTLTGADFRFSDGAILVPAKADLFGGSAISVSGDSSSDLSGVSTSAVDVTPGGSHIGFLATKGALTSGAETSVPISSSASPAEAQAAPAATSGCSQCAQAEPESVSAAQASDACLLGGCSAAPGGLQVLGHSVVEVAVVAVVGIVVVTLAVLVLRRPRPPTPAASPYASTPPSGRGPGTW